LTVNSFDATPPSARTYLQRRAADRMGEVSPVGRLERPEEIAKAIVWLRSDRASYVTGTAFAIDGGVLAS
jgi:NAD(P)-dependent dehydrogenase (short-subunit alcohol dehydrogenase family)